jgi:hypothetical protein
MTPPRRAFDLMRNARSRFGLSIRLFSMKMFFAPPDISLPMATPACPSRIVEPRTMMFSTGRATRRPSSLRPDLIATQSSPTSNTQFSIRTSFEESGLQPSLLGPWLTISRPRTITFSESTGCTSHMGDRTIFRPSISTLRLE